MYLNIANRVVYSVNFLESHHLLLMEKRKSFCFSIRHTVNCLTLFCANAQQSYVLWCGPPSSSVRPSNPFSRITFNQICGKLSIHPISRHFLFILQILHFWFFTFFLFCFPGTIWKKKIQAASLEVLHRFTRENVYILLRRSLLIKVVQRIVKFETLDFGHLF